MEVYGVVYVITCLLNSMKYVGQTTRSVERRFKEHFYEKTYIGSAMRKYGMENFKIEVIETCETREQLNEREIFWIRELNCKSPNGYNRTDGGEGIAGLKFTPEHCANISAALSGENHPLFGKHLSDEQSFNLSANQRGESPYKNLLCEIDKHKLSYAKLAERLGLANVSEKIRGEKNFTVAQVAKLVEFFGLPAEYLLARDDEDEHEKILAAKYDDSPYKILVMSMIKKRLTYSMLAERLGLSHQAVSYKMLGKVKFSESDIAKLVEIFGKPADYLMKRDDGKIFSPPNTNKTSFKNLLNEIEQRQLSYKTLAKLLGLSRASVSYKMLGKVKFSERDIAKLVEIFGKPADYLMARDE